MRGESDAEVLEDFAVLKRVTVVLLVLPATSLGRAFRTPARFAFGIES